MVINCFGERCEKARMSYRIAHTPLETKVVGGFTYNRFGDGENAAIHRLGLGADGLIEHRWTLGSWDMVETLAFEKEIDETMEVPE